MLHYIVPSEKMVAPNLSDSKQLQNEINQMFDLMKKENHEQFISAIEMLKVIIDEVSEYTSRWNFDARIYTNLLISLLKYLQTEDFDATVLPEMIHTIEKYQQELIDARYLERQIAIVSQKRHWAYDPKITPDRYHFPFNFDRIKKLLNTFKSNQPWFTKDKWLDVSAVDGNGQTIMDEAIQNNNFKLIHFLLEKNATVNIHSVLEKIGKCENIKDWMNVLLKSGADLNTQDKDGNTVFMHLLMSDLDNEEIYHYLFNIKAVNPRIVSKNKLSALDCAVKKHDFELMNVLSYFYDCPLNLKNFMNVVSNCNDLALFMRYLEFMLDNKLDLNSKDHYGRTILVHYIEKFSKSLDLDLVKKLISLGDKEALSFFVKTRDFGACDMLLKAGANIANVGQLDLVMFIDFDYDLLKLLLSSGAKCRDIDNSRYIINDTIERNINNITYAMCTPHDRFNKIIELRMLLKADLNAKEEKSGDTPLHVAVSFNDDSILEKLLAAGANPNIVNNNNKTAIEYAKSPELISLLLDCGAHITNFKTFYNDMINLEKNAPNNPYILNILSHIYQQQRQLYTSIIDKRPDTWLAEDQYKQLEENYNNKQKEITRIIDTSIEIILQPPLLDIVQRYTFFKPEIIKKPAVTENKPMEVLAIKPFAPPHEQDIQADKRNEGCCLVM